MDTSEQYIKMCDCDEIQKQKKKIKDFEDGDVLANYRLDWTTIDKYTKKAVKILEGIVIIAGFTRIAERDLVVWLPRQDQIQEMISIHYQKHLKILYDFSLTVSWDINSLEQLWLAFYMFRKHQKIWDGEKWK